MEKGKEYPMPKISLKNGRELKVTISFGGTEEECEFAYSQAVKALLKDKY